MIFDSLQNEFRKNKQTANRFLISRKIDSSTLDKFGVGYCADGYKLAARLDTKYTLHEIETCGIFRKTQNGIFSPYHKKITIPIRDYDGTIISFAARATEKDQIPKYINGCNTEFYDKGENLFGLDLAIGQILHTKKVFIVEGYFDVIALHSIGILNVVAICSSSLTKAQANIFAMLGVKWVGIMLDMDKAGNKGSERAMNILNTFKIATKRIQMPFKDPGEWLEKVSKYNIAKEIEKYGS